MKGTTRKAAKLLLIALVTLPPIGALATPGAGFVFNTILSRATVASGIQTLAHSGSWNALLVTTGPSDFVVQDVALAAGGYSGWHSHPGPVLITVKRGTATCTDARDGHCRASTYPAGSAFVEPAAVPHAVVNTSSSEDLELVNTYIVPVGVPTRHEEGQPEVCPSIP